MSTRNAFLLHLLISMTVVGAVLAIIFFVWYPAPYFTIGGAGDVVKILIGVDLILGPALTLLLYRPGKRGVMVDLGVIAAIQLTALVYGTVTIFQQRPYYAVFAVDRFEVLSRQDIMASGELPAFAEKPLRGPAYAIARLPADPATRNRIFEEVVFEGLPDIDKRPEFWGPYDAAADEVLARSRPLTAFSTADARLQAEISALRSQYADVELVQLPVMGRKGAMTLVMNPGTGRPVAALDADPWAADKADQPGEPDQAAAN